MSVSSTQVDELSDLSECIHQGMRLDGLDDLLEEGRQYNMSQYGQTIVEFFQFHQERMKEHAKMHEALRLIAESGDTADVHIIKSQAQLLLKRMSPITMGSRVVHRDVPGKGTLVDIEGSKPVVRWDRNEGSGTPVTGRIGSWDLIRVADEGR